jgi:diguanylate cyclase (GGDEF)-like protein
VRLTKYFPNKSKLFFIGTGLLLLFCIAVIDALVPPKISLSIFYLIPVTLTTWYVGEAAGIFISLSCAIAWTIANELHGFSSDNSGLIPYWNTAVRLGFFLTTTYLLSELRSALEREKKLARTDSTTGVANQRLFYELTHLELKRACRYGHPLTVAFIDIDDFKKINDKLGHKVGDKVLRKVAETISANIRETDIIARIGGDEFALLLPGTGYEPSQIVLERVQRQFLENMQAKQWSVTCSMGAITFMSSPKSVDEIIEKADYLMYVVKNGGKNRIEHKIEF